VVDEEATAGLEVDATTAALVEGADVTDEDGASVVVELPEIITTTVDFTVATDAVGDKAVLEKPVALLLEELSAWSTTEDGDAGNCEDADDVVISPTAFKDGPLDPIADSEELVGEVILVPETAPPTLLPEPTDELLPTTSTAARVVDEEGGGGGGCSGELEVDDFVLNVAVGDIRLLVLDSFVEDLDVELKEGSNEGGSEVELLAGGGAVCKVALLEGGGGAGWDVELLEGGGGAADCEAALLEGGGGVGCKVALLEGSGGAGWDVELLEGGGGAADCETALLEGGGGAGWDVELLEGLVEDPTTVLALSVTTIVTIDVSATLELLLVRARDVVLPLLELDTGNIDEELDGSNPNDCEEIDVEVVVPFNH